MMTKQLREVLERGIVPISVIARCLVELGDLCEAQGTTVANVRIPKPYPGAKSMTWEEIEAQWQKLRQEIGEKTYDDRYGEKSDRP